MNSTWKNILITVVIAIWLGFIGYSLSCFVAFLVGWSPFVAPLVFTIVTIIVLLRGLAMRKKKEISSLFFVLFCSLFISSLSNAIILGVKFSDLNYHGAVITDGTYLYNKWGWNILNVGGWVKYEDSYIYLMTNSEVYKFDYDGELIQSADFIFKRQEGHASLLLHPFTKKYFIKGSKLEPIGYDDYQYLGETEDADCFKCKTDGLWDLVMVDKEYGECNFEYSGAKTIKKFGNPIRCFVIQEGNEYNILNERGYVEYTTDKGIYGASYNSHDRQLHYEDEDGKRWYHQF